MIVLDLRTSLHEAKYAFYSDSDWTFDSTVGAAPFYYTVHIKAPTSGENGIYQLWVDDQLVIDQSDVPMGAEPFDRWEFPATCTLVTIRGSDGAVSVRTSQIVIAICISDRLRASAGALSDRFDMSATIKWRRSR